MSSQPPWMEDDRPPWEVDDTGDAEAEKFGASQMRGFMRSPSTGFGGDPRQLLSDLEREDSANTKEGFLARANAAPQGSAERERALNMAVRMGEPDAARNALLGLGAVATLPLSKAAAIRAGWGLLGSAGGGAGGTAIGSGLEKAGYPVGTSKVLGAAGGVVGGLAGGFGKGEALEKVGSAIASPFTRGMSRGVGREAAEEFARRRLELEAARLAEQQAARQVGTSLKTRGLDIAERKAIDAVKIAEARLQVAVSRNSGAQKVAEARLAVQKARDEASKKLGEARLAESMRKTDIGRDVAQARLKHQIERGVSSDKFSAERIGQGAQRTGQGAERVSQAERRLQIAEAKARRQGLIGSDDARAVSSSTSGAAPALDDATQKIVQQLQQQMGTVEGRSQIRQLLSQMDPRQASQIKDLLARGLAQPGTTASGGVRSVTKGPKIPAGYGEELARLLGQVE